MDDKETKTNKFKNSVGRYYLRGLFYEESTDKGSVLYTLKRDDHLSYPSLYRLYVETADPTEYEFAIQHLDGWAHWQELVHSEWFQPYLQEWRQELDVKIRSRALASIIDVALDKPNPNSYHANKYLLETLGKPAGALKRGRPTKGSAYSEKDAIQASLAEINEDAKRLGLN